MADVKFRPATPEVKRIAADLIERLHPNLKTYDVRVVFLMRDQPQMKNGMGCRATATVKKGLDAVLSRLNKPLEEQEPGKERPDRGAFFVVQIHQESWDDMELHQKRALIHHELCHCGVEPMDDGKMKLSLVPHDFERFNSEIAIFGAWDSDIERLMETCKPYIQEQINKLSAEEEELFERMRSSGGVPAGEGMLRRSRLLAGTNLTSVTIGATA